MARKPLYDPAEEEQEDEYEYVEVEGNQGCSGCGWGIAGLIGCLTLPVIAALILLIGGIGAFSDVMFDVGCAINPEASECIETTDRRAILISMRQLSVLLTVERTYDTTITTRVDMPYVLRGLYGDSLTLNVVQQVTAGIDLGQLTEDDISVDGDTLIVRLPPPQLQSCSILEELTGVIDRDTGLFTGGVASMDTIARQDAIVGLRNQALDAGILDEANEYSVEALRGIFEPLPLEGINELVIVTQGADRSALDIPPSCLGR